MNRYEIKYRKPVIKEREPPNYFVPTFYVNTQFYLFLATRPNSIRPCSLTFKAGMVITIK